MARRHFVYLASIVTALTHHAPARTYALTSLTKKCCCTTSLATQNNIHANFNFQPRATTRAHSPAFRIRGQEEVVCRRKEQSRTTKALRALLVLHLFGDKPLTVKFATANSNNQHQYYVRASTIKGRRKSLAWRRSLP